MRGGSRRLVRGEALPPAFAEATAGKAEQVDKNFYLLVSFIFWAPPLPILHPAPIVPSDSLVIFS